MKGTPVFGKLRTFVPPDSASFGRGVMYHLNEHHHNVCKPTDRNSASYGIILNFVKDALHKIGQN